MLKLLSNPFDVAEYVTVKTNAYGKFSLNGGKYVYSTAPKYTNSRVLGKITPCLRSSFEQAANAVAKALTYGVKDFRQPCSNS